ncbi:MAG: PLDc N-terminal domain-containing protein [Deltaproteobacteria bacterium]|nr:PLDc N-terminal domain-containing protein [Candidatus Anaeroferrophillacea bacterium]
MSPVQWLYGHFFEILGYLLALVLVPRILLERRHPGATVAWLLAIGLVPFLGVPLYFLIGGKRIRRIARDMAWGVFPPPAAGPAVPGDFHHVCELMTASGAFSPAGLDGFRIIDDGTAAYERVVELIGDAGHSIEVATFILGRDAVGRELVSLLAHKAREGVEVRLLLDGFGSFFTRWGFVRPLREMGGKVGVFLPLFPFRRRWSANLRNHRKMIIVDSRKALVGGMNLAADYLGPRCSGRHWKDILMELDGAVVAQFRQVFAHDWHYTTGEEMVLGDAATAKPLPVDPPPPAASTAAVGAGIAAAERNSVMVSPAVAGDPPDGRMPAVGDLSARLSVGVPVARCRPVQLVADGPDFERRPLYAGVLAALHQARESIWVVTPYFVPDEPLSAALELAARMGRDVRLVVPERSNHPLVDLAAGSYLTELVHAGARLYRYRPGMMHAKMIVIDGRLAISGSANVDIRSFQLNFELATFFFHAADVAAVRLAAERIIAASRLVLPRDMRQKSRGREFAEDLCRVFSPLL